MSVSSKQSEHMKTLIKKCVEKWKQKLYLGVWTIDIDYESFSEQEPTCIAETEAKFDYLVARTTFFLSAIERRAMSDKLIEQYVVHEMVHILLAGHQHFMKDGDVATVGLMERETQLVTYALVGLDRGES